MRIPQLHYPQLVYVEPQAVAAAPFVEEVFAAALTEHMRLIKKTSPAPRGEWVPPFFFSEFKTTSGARFWLLSAPGSNLVTVSRPTPT